MYYDIYFSENNETFIQLNPIPYIKPDAVVDYSVAGLKPLTRYTIRVTAENGVSNQENDIESVLGRSCVVAGETGDTRKSHSSPYQKYYVASI